MAKKKTSRKAWQHRLTAEADEATAELVASIDVDAALYKYDIAGSLAHATMLREIGVLTAAELAEIERGLKQVAEEIESGRVELDPALEDIHMVVEAALIERIGEPGRKLHTGRSRNDQVALDLRLWARDAVDDLTDLIRRLQSAFVAMAERDGGIVMPAYTHLQRAQPVLAGHALLAYVEMLERDADRLADCRKRINVCPLGSGAVAGTSIPLDRRRVAELLGFVGVTRNSIDATSDRDFLAEMCFDLAALAGHLGRWAEDWILFSTTEFGFVELHDAYCTSSSMMPQKKNADTLELIRAKSASAIAALVGLLTLTRSLPSGYNRDLQDDKRLAMPAVAAMRSALTVAAGIVSTAKLRADRIEAGLDEGFLDATALAEYLVGKGVAFRTAHQIVAGLVGRAEKQGVPLAGLPMDALQSACDRIGPDVKDHLGAANVVKRYAPEGSAGAKQLRKQLAFWRTKLAGG
ncbi:MAG TPA: argininosuccinate lyase [Phycisphaerae bacterium]|nr:argininosuccinate lyase [Phycisphaerae bacterium]